MSVNDSSPSNDNENIYCSDFDIIKQNKIINTIKYYKEK